MRKPNELPRTQAVASPLVTGLAGPSAFAAAPSGTNPLQPGAQLYVDPNSTTVEAAARLTGADRSNALSLAQYPTATWFERGTPEEVATQVDRLVTDAKAAGQVPILVVYNLPGRDGADYSAGGAADLEAYQKWIDGLATSIGDSPAVVILEPDGLGKIPGLDCSNPPGFDPNDRFAAIMYAVTALKANDNTAVYLDATHSGWWSVGDITQRLFKGGIQQADGFFLNASNYQYTTNQVFFGTWISNCIALAETSGDPASYDFNQCPNQFWNGGPSTGGKASPQGDGALSPFVEWSSQPFADPDHPTADELTSLPGNTAGIDSRYAELLGDAILATTHFVIDTSRNGVGPWDPSSTSYSDPQDWCNPPVAGIGIEPTTDTGNGLVDAYLWLKVPGESDGECDRGGGNGLDEAWGGITDPAAGEWFPAQAAMLIAKANPPLTRPIPTP